ncbi:hypothetical protein Dimus_038968 [Dionaea muscipula]
MFCLYRKLRLLKVQLRRLNREEFSDLSKRVERARQDLLRAQGVLLSGVGDIQSGSVERDAAMRFRSLARMEESMLRQKARVRWLELGDRNTAFFFSSVRCRQNRGGIRSLICDDGQEIRCQQELMAEARGFFSSLLSVASRVTRLRDDQILPLIRRSVPQDQVSGLTAPVSAEEVRATFFALGRHKAPGPDGYSVEFFRSSWSDVGLDVTRAVMDFFDHARLLREANGTILSLIPKVTGPTRLTDFKPISCCNTVYKYISRIIVTRVRVVLPGLIGSEQSAFVRGRRIGDSILVAHELLCGYHLDRSPPRCAIKIDIMKAYDSIEWDFLRIVLAGFGFPSWLVQRIMECVTTASFSVVVNGELTESFRSSRGLRQGDPLSPYLFVLCMEVLSEMLCRVAEDRSFEFHWRCRKVGLTHLCFADDLMIFSRETLLSVSRIISALEGFRQLSGLRMSPLKSEIFFGGVAKDVRQSILTALGFRLGHLPVRYLVVPLISSRLTAGDCQMLVDRISARVQH